MSFSTQGLKQGTGGGTGTTNLGYIASPTNGTVTSSTGTSATITTVDATNAGLATPLMFTNSHVPVVTTDGASIDFTQSGTDNQSITADITGFSGASIGQVPTKNISGGITWLTPVTDTTTVSDTNTIDLTLTGTNISGDVKIDPAVGNLTSITTNGLLTTFVSDFTISDNTNTSLINNHGTVTFLSGAGITQTVGVGIVTTVAKLSTDVGNNISFGTDTGLYVPKLKWYSENTASPAIAPTATGAGSIAIGSGAVAIGDNIFSFGNGAGVGVSAPESNFFGVNAGNGATNANNANFFGSNAGKSAVDAGNSNFFGVNAGLFATKASNSNFFGSDAGNSATKASSSNFFGQGAGSGAINANNSIFIGKNSGASDTVNNFTGGTSILIGDNTGTGGFSDSIAIGKGAINTSSNQFMIGSNAGTLYDIVNPKYLNTRNDSGTTTPINIIYTDINGKFLSAPLSIIGDMALNVIAYGSTITVNSRIHVVFTGGTGACTVSLDPTTPVGVTVTISDLDLVANTNNIIVDADIGNTIVGVTAAQAYTMSNVGESLTLQKVTANKWKII